MWVDVSYVKSQIGHGASEPGCEGSEWGDSGGTPPQSLKLREGVREMLVVKADVGICQGYANCVENAPLTFALDAEGTVMLLRESVGEEERGGVERAVGGCPVSALSLLEY